MEAGMTVDDVVRLLKWRRSGDLIVPQQQLPPSLRYVCVRLSHEDVFGKPLPEEDLIDRLRGLSRSALLSAIAQFMLRISVASPSDSRFQAQVVDELLPPVAATRAKDAIGRGDAVAAFDPQGAAALAKLVLLHSQERGHGPTQMRRAFDSLAELLLATTDALGARVDEVRETRDRAAGEDWLANHVIRVMAFGDSPNYGHEAARYGRMFLRQAYEPRVRRLPDWLDVRSAFAEVVGQSLEDYLAAGLAIVAFQMPKGSAVDPPRACIKPRRWLQGFPTRHGQQVMRNLLSAVSAPASKAARKIADRIDTAFFFGFSLFEERPMIRVPGDLICTISHQWLAEAVTSGVYWRLRKGLGQARRQHFCNMVGQLFEMYVGDLLKSCLPARSVFPVKLSRKRGGGDFALFLGEDAFFFEAATSHLQKQGTEVEGRASAVERDLADLARKASQAIISANDFVAGTSEYPSISPRRVRRSWPIVVTLHHIAINPFTLRRLRQQAIDRTPARPGIRPPLFIDIAELEDLCSLVESGGDFVKIISDWTTDVSHSEWPLPNYLSTIGARRPLVQLLQGDFNRLADLAQRTFGEDAS